MPDGGALDAADTADAADAADTVGAADTAGAPRGEAYAGGGVGVLRLVVRSYARDPEPGGACLESRFHSVEWPVVIPVAQAALVLVDVWDTHVIASHAARTAEIARTRIAPAIRAARRAGVAVIHAPSPVQARRYPQWTRYASEADAAAPATRTWPDLMAASEVEGVEWPPRAFRRREGEYGQFRRPRPVVGDAGRDERAERRIDPSVEPAPEDYVVATGDQLHRLCADRGILHLFYAGFAANICIPFKDYGIRAFRARGYNAVLLRDGTTAIEGHDTLDGLRGTAQAIRELEMADLASTVTSAAFIEACDGASQEGTARQTAEHTARQTSRHTRREDMRNGERAEHEEQRAAHGGANGAGSGSAGTKKGATRRAAVRTGVGVATATGALWLAACGTTAAPAPAKKVRTTAATVRFMALGSGASMTWQQQQFEKFNQTIGAEQKIVVSPEPESDQTKLFEKFQATSAGGSAPDVTRLKEVWVFESAAKGALAKLDGYFKADKEFNAADLLPRFQDSLKFKGANYAVARELSLTIPFFNRSLAEGAGLDPNKTPTTYEEFRDWARRMTKPGADTATSQWGFDWYEYGTREIIMNQFLGFVRRFGGEFWNKDRTAVAINSQAGYDVMDYLVTLIQRDRSTVPPDSGVPSPWSAGRTTGKVGIWETTTTGIPNYPVNNPDLKFGVFLWPKRPGNNQNLACAGSAVAATSKDLDATWEFVKWWNAPAQQMGFYTSAGGNAPSRKSLFEAPPFTTDPLWKIVMPGFTSPDGRTRPLAERYNELAESMTPHLMDGFRGKVPPKQAVDAAAQAGTAFWKSIGGNAEKAGPE